MHSDVQGIAVVVEHIMRALGGRKEQLYEIFKELWADPEVVAMLKDNSNAHLARQKVQAANWKTYMQRIDVLRQGNEKQRIVADLVLAHRIRGSVHQELPEGDAWALEDLFAGLIRAAVRTFAHMRASTP